MKNPDLKGRVFVNTMEKLQLGEGATWGQLEANLG